MRQSTATIVCDLSGYIDRTAAFYLLPEGAVPTPDDAHSKETRGALPGRSAGAAAAEFAARDMAGKIALLRYNGKVRGMARGEPRSDFFRHTLVLEVWTNTKKLSTKISWNRDEQINRVHIVGAQSDAHGREAIGYIFRHLTGVQQQLDRISRLPEDVIAATSSWAKAVHAEQTAPQPAGASINAELAELLGRCAPCYADSAKYARRLDKLLCVRRVWDHNVAIARLRLVMSNYYFRLGFPVRRCAVARAFHRRNGFFAYFYNTIEDVVTVKLRTTNPQGESHWHTFRVYKAGLVMYSCPDFAMLETARDGFLATIAEVRNDIVSTA